MIGGCALNHGLEKVRAQKCGTSVCGGCAWFVTARNDWDEFLDILAFAYNNSIHSSTKEKLAMLLMGYKPQALLSLLQEENANVFAKERVERLIV